MAKENRPHKYATPNHPAYSVQLLGGTVTGKDKVISFTDAEHAKLLELFESGQRPDLHQNLRKIDAHAAEAIAKQHMAAQKPQAAQGAVSTANKPKTDNQVKPGADIKVPEGSMSLKERLQAQQRENAAAVQESDAVHAEDLKTDPAV